MAIAVLAVELGESLLTRSPLFLWYGQCDDWRSPMQPAKSLVLDEPTAELDPRGCWKYDEMCRDLVTHQMDDCT